MKTLILLITFVLYVYGNIAVAGEAYLTWVEPTENTDGTKATNLYGYIVHWDTGDMFVPAPANSYTVTGLEGGRTYTFTVQAVSKSGLVSDYSNKASRMIINAATWVSWSASGYPTIPLYQSVANFDPKTKEKIGTVKTNMECGGHVAFVNDRIRVYEYRKCGVGVCICHK